MGIMSQFRNYYFEMIVKIMRIFQHAKSHKIAQKSWSLLQFLIKIFSRFRTGIRI
jgi:hypothetical protein